MMAIQTKRWDPVEALDSLEAIAAYLDTYLEDGSPEEVGAAIRVVRRVKGVILGDISLRVGPILAGRLPQAKDG